MSSLQSYYGDLTPKERAAWKQHFRDYPPGDFLTQRLLAVIGSMIASLGGGKSVKPKDIAPWLHWEEPENTNPIENLALEAIMQAKEEELNG